MPHTSPKFTLSLIMQAAIIHHTHPKHYIDCAKVRTFSCYDMTIMNRARERINAIEKVHLLKLLSEVILMQEMI